MVRQHGQTHHAVFPAQGLQRECVRPPVPVGKALVECAQEVVKRRNAPAGTVVGYEQIAEEAFGRLGRLIISAIIYVELFGTCCLLFILQVSAVMHTHCSR